MAADGPATTPSPTATPGGRSPKALPKRGPQEPAGAHRVAGEPFDRSRVYRADLMARQPSARPARRRGLFREPVRKSPAAASDGRRAGANVPCWTSDGAAALTAGASRKVPHGEVDGPATSSTFDGPVQPGTGGTACADFAAARRDATISPPETALRILPSDGDRQAYTVLARDAGKAAAHTATLTFATLRLGAGSGWAQPDRVAAVPIAPNGP